MTTGGLILAALCAGAGLVMIRKKLPFATAWTALWAGVAMILVVFRLAAPPPALAEALERADGFNFSAGQVLGEHLAGIDPDARVLILVPPELQGVKNSRALVILEGLREALPGAEVETRSPDVPASFRAELDAQVAKGELFASEIPMRLVQYTEWFDAGTFAALMDELKDQADIVVCNLEIPPHRPGDGWPRLAVLNAPVRHLKSHLASGRIEAAVTLKPGPSTWKKVGRVPADARRAFDLRWLMITRDNLAAVASENPMLFGGGS